MDGDLNQVDSVFTISDMSIQTKNANYLINLKTTISPTNYLDLAGKYFDLNLEIESQNMRDIDYFYPLMEEETLFSDEFIDNRFGLKTEIYGTNNDLSIRQFQSELPEFDRNRYYRNLLIIFQFLIL